MGKKSEVAVAQLMSAQLKRDLKRTQRKKSHIERRINELTQKPNANFEGPSLSELVDDYAQEISRLTEAVTLFGQLQDVVSETATA